MKKLLFVLATMLLGASPVMAQGFVERYVEGVHYLELPEPQPVETGKKIEVREFFWYGCPHCFSLEPSINSWLKTKPANAQFVRSPAILRDDWEPHARAYFAFKTLGVLNKLHEPFFYAVQVKRRPLNDEQAIAKFASEHGVDPKRFQQAYNSFSVGTTVKQAREVDKRYGVVGVPSLVVDGKYRTSPAMAGGNDAAMDIVNFLVKKAAGERTQKK